MPAIQPSVSDEHVDFLLSDLSLAFIQDADNFVAGEVFPEIPSSHRSNLYATYERGDFNRNDMKERAPGTESAGGSYTVSKESFFCRVRAFHKDIHDQVIDNSDDIFDDDRDATEFVTGVGLINREVRWASSYFVSQTVSGAPWTFFVDGAATPTSAILFNPTDNANNDKAFWDLASSTPIEDIRQGKRFVGESTGFRPNTLTLGRAVFDTLVDHPDIVGRFDAGQTPVGPALVNRQKLAVLFEVDRVLVMDAIQNTAAEGVDPPVHEYIGGKHALLSYRPASPGRLTPSAGYTFIWTGHLGATQSGMRILRLPAPLLASRRIEIESADDQKVVAPDLGYIFGNIVQ